MLQQSTETCQSIRAALAKWGIDLVTDEECAEVALRLGVLLEDLQAVMALLGEDPRALLPSGLP